MSEFSERALAHLSRYKLEELGIREHGIFQYRGANIEKSHILPFEERDHNLLPLVRSCFRNLTDTAGKKLKWHRYFSHLNSSQGLAVNLFQPFLTNSTRRAILAQLLELRPPLKIAGFEHVPDLVEATNVDFFAQSSKGGSLLIEVKFTESGFGKAKNDPAHRQKYEEIYRDRLKRIARFDADEQSEFFAAYQFFRNAIFAGIEAHQPARVWFLVPRDNVAIRRAAENCMLRLDPEIAPRIEIMELERLLEEIDALVRHDAKLTTHFAQFRHKYIVPS